ELDLMERVLSFRIKGIESVTFLVPFIITIHKVLMYVPSYVLHTAIGLLRIKETCRNNVNSMGPKCFSRTDNFSNIKVHFEVVKNHYIVKRSWFRHNLV